ncbi:hypothetical protein ACN2MM_02515 [Alkalilimnicola ehrlichii MLHE-1]|uniref:Uncharacterized protein n=1 Tax=Alkalilimnicola ehrlichii (strain ATCC BAA-1101 / DSM 17681 / MLHE-1) TaxID=187272 RepID=Q0ABP0_ALKEH|nr:hypothetical protein [Alkalilimnicola ehrlichii]ABI55747.1 hypothetical protein Mlg_0393 [Alkalilimnicola ehrlichii MLHE-1]
MSTTLAPLSQRLIALGSMRWFLMLCALLCLVLRPEPGTGIITEGWALVPTLLAPVLAPLVVVVMLLDALMARVFMTDTAGPQRQHYRLAILVNVAIAVVVTLYWLPYYLAIGQ